MTVWDGIRTNLTSDVSAGGTEAVAATVQALAAAGTYCLRMDLVQENVTWFSWQSVPTLNITVTVT